MLWFDELYVSHADYQWHVVDAAAARIRLLICVGTSLAVGVTSFLQSAAADAQAPVFLVDPGERPREAASVDGARAGQGRGAPARGVRAPHENRLAGNQPADERHFQESIGRMPAKSLWGRGQQESPLLTVPANPYRQYDRHR